MVDNRGPQLQAVCSAFVSMAFFSTALRCWVRGYIVKSFGWDDITMVSAALTHIMFATCAIAGIHYGTGRHMSELSDEAIYKAMLYWWLCYIAYCLTMIAAKISIGIFFLRLTVSRIHHWIIYIVMSLTFITGIVFFFVTLLQCHPISFFWNRHQPGGCIDVKIIMGLTYLYGGISSICDFTFGILPIFLIWNLNMDRRTKIALVPILSMACVASTAVLVRMAYVKNFDTDDFLYQTVDIAIWSDTEQGLAITAGSLATLRPLFRVISERFGISSSSKGTGPMKSPGPTFSNHMDRTGGNRSNRARRGPFSFLSTLGATQHEPNELDEEYRLSNIKPIPLHDSKSINEDKGADKGNTFWKANEKKREKDSDSQEELHRKSDSDGIYFPGR